MAKRASSLTPKRRVRGLIPHQSILDATKKAVVTSKLSVDHQNLSLSSSVNQSMYILSYDMPNL